MKKTIFLIFNFLILLINLPIYIIAQIPTAQDCMGAIPICQNVYSTTTAYSGSGNYPSEINTVGSGCPNNCLWSGEKNDVWYTFSVQASGNLSFLITPNDLYDDYDWAVYNLSNASCADIFNDISLQVSCNYSGTSGTTGPNDPSSTLTCQGGGDGVYNAVIPVLVGETYVINVSNYSSSQSGYTIDFSASTAVIFDNIPPTIQSILSSTTCGIDTIQFTFSENILCSTIAPCDFTITGQGGPYTINSVTGVGCSSGGLQEKIFTVSFNPAITTTGTFHLNLNASSCNSVTDLCGNVAPSDNLSFNITGITTNIINIVNPLCGQSDGSATATASGGSGIFTYLWSTTPVQASATVSNIPAGTYYVTVNDGSCSGVDTLTLINAGSNLVTSFSNIINEICGSQNAGATVNATGGTPPFSYIWSSTPVQTTSVLQNVSAGTYYVTLTDANNCTAKDTLTLINTGSNIVTNLSNIIDEICGSQNAGATVNATGGTPPYSYIWSSAPVQTDSVLHNVSAGTYYVTLTDVNNCNAKDTLILTNKPAPIVTIDQVIDDICNKSIGSVSTVTTGGFGNYTYLWNTIPPQTTSSASNLSAGIYTVIVNDSICSDTASATVNNIHGPIANFSAYPEAQTIMDGPVIFIDNSFGNIINWIWDFGDGSAIETGQNVSHQYNALDTFYVKLIITDNGGCVDSIIKTVIISDIYTFYIPNCFTPNSDEKNDLFGPLGLNISPNNYQMLIYDRWGNLVFKTNNPNEFWNGTFNNKGGKNNVQLGVYVYKIILRELSGIKHFYNGRVTVLP